MKKTIYLRESATGKLVEAELFDEVSDHHLLMWEETWKPSMREHCVNRVLSDRPEDSHWDWRRKSTAWRPLLGFHSFAITCHDELQGLMLVSDIRSARLTAQFGKPLVYVEFISTAPWNRSEVQQPLRYQGVGGVLIDEAIQLSLNSGYCGRIGLHSLPQAAYFYRKKCGMSELGIDYAHEKLMYFEMTEQQAESFRQKRGQK